ncbi:hypothetical protein OpiT1DRAFT_04645 [Opitutaceae bacterium TAV1]|nr:hypothetical protein OPIT5_03420 [Opitutaceae bacterium TAV5]EIQ00106.1 hypothetical protein OpiT1DRAFT_04645 [Opitutaceae bacterium TAV1]
MKSKALLSLGLCVAIVSLSGCATQQTRTGRTTNVLGGLVTVKTGYWQSPSPTTIDGNVNELWGDAGNPSGTQVSLGWGLITANDY